MKNNSLDYYSTTQGILPMFITDYLDVCDPVIEIDRLLSHIDINKYLDDIPHHKLGCLRYDPVRMFKTVAFGFADHGYVS